jgi:hypothetical protein
MLVPIDESKEAHVHAGFLIAYTSVERAVRDILRRQLEQYPDYDVVVTGTRPTEPVNILWLF